MDPIVAAVVTVLGKYVIDKGTELAREVGPKAAEVAASLFVKVVERFSQDPGDRKILQRFERNPQDYRAAVADSLEDHLKDPEFSEAIRELLTEYAAATPATTGDATAITQIAGDDAIQFGRVSGGDITITKGQSQRHRPNTDE